MSSWFKKQYTLLEQPVTGYSRAVALLKKSLLVMALLLSAALILMPMLSEDQKVQVYSDEIEETEGFTRMINPEFQGKDKQGQPFTIRAESAIVESEDHYTMIRPSGDITLENGTWVAVMSDKGMLNRSENTVDLSGEVGLFFDNGFEFLTHYVKINMNDKSATGYFPVEGKGALGTIEANYFAVKNKGELLHFGGGVKVILYPGAQAGIVPGK